MASSSRRSIHRFFRSATALPAAGAFAADARPVVFVVRLVPEDHEFLLVCDGDGSVVARIRLFRGLDALPAVRKAYRTMSWREDAGVEEPEPYLEIEYDEDEMLPPEYLRFLRSFGIDRESVRRIPLPVAFSADAGRRPLNAAETTLIARVCEGLEIALRSGEAKRADLFEDPAVCRITLPPEPTIVTVAVDHLPLEPARPPRAATIDEDLPFAIQLLSARLGLAIVERFAELEPRIANFLGAVRNHSHRDDRRFTQAVFGCAQWLACRDPATARNLLGDSKLGPISATDDAILRACAGATPRCYRIAPRDGDSCVVVDVSDGTKHRVEDLALWQADAVDRWTAGAIVQVGETTLFSRWLPILEFERGLHAPAIFERFDFLPTAHDLAERPDRIGRLADLLLVPLPPLERGRAPRRSKSDLVAGFRVDDPRALRAALRDRPDIVFLDGDEFGWFAPDAGASGLRKRIATMRLVTRGDAKNRLLVLEPDSEAVLAAAIEWLEAVPGVTFEQLGARALARIMEPGAPLPDPGPRELRRAELRVRAALDRSIEAWLDRPLRSLRDESPRDAARDPRRREFVRFLVGILPGAGGHGAPRVEPDRAAILARLGLE